jgi:hypothetical protein
MPVTLSPVVPERYAGTTRVLACKVCSLLHHPDWNQPPEWAYPIPHPQRGWDNDPAVVLIDHTYQLGGAARLYRTRIAMCPRHAEMYLGQEKLQSFLVNQPRQIPEVQEIPA